MTRVKQRLTLKFVTGAPNTEGRTIMMTNDERARQRRIWRLGRHAHEVPDMISGWLVIDKVNPFLQRWYDNETDARKDFDVVAGRRRVEKCTADLISIFKPALEDD